MNVQQRNKKKGFTIIEVVLVLAIAGLIFLMVFIALPALQRGQRDGQRRNDLSRVLSKLQDYQTNNRNKLPAASEWNTTFVTQYLRAGGDTFDDPSRGPYQLKVDEASPTFDTATAWIHVATTKVCDGENLQSAGSQKVAFRMKLEGGGVACFSN
jgi:prepilin-type N-terminal cleavage/methylation domain-containing protein